MSWIPFGNGGAPITPGRAAVREFCQAFVQLDGAQKEALAQILIRISPSLAAQSGAVNALPLDRIAGALKAALRKAWIGIANPGRLLAQIGEAFSDDEAAADLR